MIRILAAAMVLVLIQVPPSTTSIAGLWATDGYGLVLDISADALQFSEVTKVSCMPSLRASASAAPPGALGAFTPADAPASFVILPGPTAAEARVHVSYAASDMIIRRIGKKPAVCDTPTPNTPLSNFDVFAETWAEHYPFFAERRVDWRAVVAANRVKVKENTTPQELFAVLAAMIAPLDDAHSSISARSINQTLQPVRRTPSFLASAERNDGYALVSAHLTAPLQRFCEGQIEFGMLAADVGYLRIRGFSGYAPRGSGAFETGLAALEAALDTIFAGARGWSGLVIDVRLNGGGADPYGITIARRLTATPYTAYAKQARNDPADATKWTAAQPSEVRPSDRPGFHGPVVELIGVQSVSAAETFTQALMNRSPKVTRLGETTQGVFSDVLGRRMPNGWFFGLANERFVTSGRSYDVTGIAPDVAVESLTPAARATGKDAAVLRALEILKGARQPLEN